MTALLGRRVERVDHVGRDAAASRDVVPVASGPLADGCALLTVDRATAGHFVEIDLISPRLAEADPTSRRQPWFPLVGAARDPARPVSVWTRGERSFVVVLP